MNEDVETEPVVQQREVIEHNGYYLDPDTGEVLGIVTPTEGPTDRFVVHDLPTCEWVLERMQQQDAEIVGLESLLAARVQALKAQIKQAEGRKAFLLYRFGEELKAFAAAHLEGKKTKTLSTGFGKLSFKTKAGGVSLVDEASALEWAEVERPEMVRVSKSLIHADFFNLPADNLPPGFELKGPEETFSVSTGVKAAKEAQQ